MADDVKRALLTRDGPCGPLYDLVLSYENAEWDRVTLLAEQLGIPPGLLTTLYFECMENANQIWESINLQAED